MDNSGTAADIKKLIKSLDPLENVNERQDPTSGTVVERSETGEAGKAEEMVDNTNVEDASEGQARIENDLPEAQQFKYVNIKNLFHIINLLSI